MNGPLSLLDNGDGGLRGTDFSGRKIQAETDQVCPSGERRWMQESGRGLLTGGAIISNGVIKLGLYDEGALNAKGKGLIFINPSGVEVESTFHGCPCEGWGASATRDSTGASFSGHAFSDMGTGTNMAPQPIMSNGVDAFIDITVTTGPLRVTHHYFPSPDTSNLYVADVTYENTSSTETLTNLRYRRVMDWDIPPFIFNECVTIDVGTSSSVEGVSNDGFASPDPLTSTPTGTASSYDIGPRDQGALFQFLFKKPDDGALVTLAPGETFTFQIFYGAAVNKADAAQALTDVGAEVSHLDLQYSAVTSATSSNYSTFPPCRSSLLGFLQKHVEAAVITMELQTLSCMASRVLAANQSIFQELTQPRARVHLPRPALSLAPLQLGSPVCVHLPRPALSLAPLQVGSPARVHLPRPALSLAPLQLGSPVCVHLPHPALSLAPLQVGSPARVHLPRPVSSLSPTACVKTSLFTLEPQSLSMVLRAWSTVVMWEFLPEPPLPVLILFTRKDQTPGKSC
jgi:hypothetical protein